MENEVPGIKAKDKGSSWSYFYKKQHVLSPSDNKIVCSLNFIVLCNVCKVSHDFGFAFGERGGSLPRLVFV